MSGGNLDRRLSRGGVGYWRLDPRQGHDTKQHSFGVHTMIDHDIAMAHACEIRALPDDEIAAAVGGVFEASFLGVTLQVNADRGCFAVCYGKEYVGGGCKK